MQDPNATLISLIRWYGVATGVNAAFALVGAIQAISSSSVWSALVVAFSTLVAYWCWERFRYMTGLALQGLTLLVETQAIMASAKKEKA